MDDVATLKYNTASDTDEEEVDKAGLVTAPTQPYTVAETATQRYSDGDETDVDDGIANAPTLAYTVAEAATQMYGEQSDSEDGNDASDVLAAAPTLAYDKIDENRSKDQGCEDTKDDTSDGDETDEEVDLAGLATAPTQAYTVAEAATQRYSDGDETDEEVDLAGLATAPTQAYTVAEAATQRYSDGDETDEEVDLAGLATAPTQAYTVAEAATQRYSDGDETDEEVDLAGLATAPTQAYTVAEAATQRYSDGDETDEEVDLAGLATAPTQAYTVAEAATQRYDDVEETDEDVDAEIAVAPTLAYTASEAATQRYDDVEETDEDVDAEIAAAPTLAYTAAEAATQRYGEDSDSEDSASGVLAAAPTLAYDNMEEKEAEESCEDEAAAPTLAYDVQTQNYEENEAPSNDGSDSNGKNEAIAEPDKTVTKTVDDEECTDDKAPTVCCDAETLDAQGSAVEPQVQGNPEEKGSCSPQALDDVPTLVFGVDDENAATQVFGEDDENAPTQVFGEDDETAATQAFGVDDETAATQVFGEDDETAATQAFGVDDETAATQVFGEDEQGPSKHVVGSVKQQTPSAQPLVTDELIETQAYGVEDEPTDTADSNTPEIDVTGDTQVPDSQETEELEIESILRKVPGKSVLISPEKKVKNQEKKRVVFSSIPEFEPQRKSDEFEEGKKTTKGKKQKNIKDKKEVHDNEVLDASRRSGRSRKQTARMKDSVGQKKRRSLSSNAEGSKDKDNQELVDSLEIGTVKNDCEIGKTKQNTVAQTPRGRQNQTKNICLDETDECMQMDERQTRGRGSKEKIVDENMEENATTVKNQQEKSNKTRNMKSSLKENKVDKTCGEEQMEEKQTRGRRSKKKIVEEEKEESIKNVEDAFQTDNTIQNTVAQTPRGRSNKTRNMKSSLKEDKVDKTGGEEQMEEKQSRGSRSKRNIVEEEKEEGKKTVKDAFETENILGNTVAETPRGSRRNKTKTMKTSLEEERVDKTDRDEQVEGKQSRGSRSKRNIVVEEREESTKTVKDAFETENILQNTVAETPRGSRRNKTKTMKTSLEEERVDKTDRDEQVEEKQTRGRGSKRNIVEEKKEKSTKTVNDAFETDNILWNTVAETPRGSRKNKTKTMKTSLEEERVNKTDGDEQMEEKQTRGRGSKWKVVEEENQESMKTVKGAFETDNTLQNTVAETPRGSRRNKTKNMKTSLERDRVDKTDRDEQMEEKQTRGRGSKRKVVEEEKQESTKTLKDAFETDNTLKTIVAETPRGRRSKKKNMKNCLEEDKVDEPDGDKQMEDEQTRGRGSKRKIAEQESTKTEKNDCECDITIQNTVAQTPRGKSNKTKIMKNSRLKEDKVDETDRDEQMEEKQTSGRGSKRKVVEEEKKEKTEPRSRASERGKAEQTEEINSQKITKIKSSSTICQSPTPSKKAKKTQEEDLPCSPSLRKRANDSKPKIMFTGVVDEDWEKIVKSLGGELVTSIHDCTHLITDKIRRTVKFLCGLAKGAYLIDPKWLEESKKRKSFVNPDNFLVTDRASEKQHGFSVKRSHDMAIETRLFEGYKIHVTSSVKPDTNQMKDIIRCAGGEFLSRMPNKYEENVVVVSSKEDEARCNSALNVGIPIVSSEFILTGILKQEIHIEPYRLFIEVPSSASKSKPSASAKKGTTSKRRR